MKLLEASEKLERIELLAKFSYLDEITSKEKTVALIWISEMAEELNDDVRKELQIFQGGRR